MEVNRENVQERWGVMVGMSVSLMVSGQCLLCLRQVCNMENVDPLCHRWSVSVVFVAGL